MPTTREPEQWRAHPETFPEIPVLPGILSIVPAGLVCEDDQGIRLLMEVVLKRENLAVDSAGDGAEAAQMLAEKEYDVIVVDLMMPRFSGFDLIEQIRTDRPELLRRVVVVTAAAAVIRDRSPKDVAAVILKPFDVEELASTVRRVVSA